MKKLINLTLLFLLILGIYSCLKDEFQLSGSNEKSAGDEKELIEVAQDWYLTNPSKNDYSLIHVSEKLKWSQAIVHQLDTATIVEIPIKLKENNSLKIKYEYELNIEQRLLIINNGNQTYSLLEFFISTDSKENLSNIKKLNFIENKDYFEGTLLLVNSAGESVMAKQIENVEESAEFKLKSIEVRCLVLVYEYSDGTYDIISVLYCYEIDNGVDGGGSGNPPYTDPDDCGCDICPICRGCIMDELKSIPIPPEDGGETTIDCPTCSCEIILDIDGYEDYITECEADLIAEYPIAARHIYNNKSEAQAMTISIFGRNGLNDCSDAFRHAYFQALNTKSIGSLLTQDFSDAHECETPSQLQLEKLMDLHNNSVGINIALINSIDDIKQAVLDALNNGELLLIDGINEDDPNFFDDENPTHGITDDTRLISTSTNRCF